MSPGDFFDTPQPAAKLKHAVLEGYLPVFANKTASAAPGRRGVYIDGYAGRGEYRDGGPSRAPTPGSPLIAERIRHGLAHVQPPKWLECWYVERKGEYFEHLRSLVGDSALPGSVEDRVPSLLQSAVGAPLFAFLDPFGVGLPIETLIQLLHRPQPTGRRSWPTELLLNFSVQTLRREAAMVKTSSPSATGTRENIDRNLGGDYWRTMQRPGDLTVDDRIVQRYCSLIARDAGGHFTTWSIPVSDRWDASTADYYLILVTGHPEGGWFFADALARALPKFYAAAVRKQLSLFDPELQRHQASLTMERNIAQLLDERDTFTLIEHTKAIYRGALGKGGIPQMRAALKRLHERGLILDAPKGGLHRLRVRRGPARTLF